MWISISYDDALKRFPTAVAEALAALKKSRSKYKKDDPATMEWGLSYGIKARNSGSIYDMMANAGKPDPYDSMTLEERVEDAVSRTIASVVVLTPRTGYFSRQMAEVPEEIREQYRQQEQAPPKAAATIAKWQEIMGKHGGAGLSVFVANQPHPTERD